MEYISTNMRRNLTILEAENYPEILGEFLNENLEEFYDSYLEMIDSKECDISLFKELMFNLFLTDHQHFFEIIAKVISNNNLDNSNDFYLLTTYNYYFKDWKIENDIHSNDDKRVVDFFDNEPYAFLCNVDVYALRSANTLCLVHHCPAEFTSLEYYPIQLNNIQSQLNQLSQEIGEYYN